MEKLGLIRDDKLINDVDFGAFTGNGTLIK